MNISGACETGNLAWLKHQKVLGQLPDVMQKNSDGWYPHELAAKNGHLDVVKWLVKESGQPVDVTADDNEAVHRAARNGRLDVVKWLVRDYTDWLTSTKLEDPSFTGQPVDVTAGNNLAVRSAAANGHLDVIKWLVEESGQPVDVTADDNWAVYAATENRYTAIVDYLNFVTPLIQAVGLEICRSVGFDAISEMLTSQAASKSTIRRL